MLPQTRSAPEEQSVGSPKDQPPVTELTLRPGRPADAAECGRICFEAFRSIASQHDFPADFPSADAARELFDFALAQPDTYSVVAEMEGRIVGSNMSWEQTPIAGIGPITVAPDLQNVTVGRHLMAHVLDGAKSRNCRGMRLVQAAYHNRSLALYLKLGFHAREPLSVLQGHPINASIAGHVVRPAGAGDIKACAELHTRLHGFSRAGDLTSAIAQGTAMVVERNGRISGYATGIGFFTHAVGESNSDIMALIDAARAYAGPGFMVPTRNAALMDWCLEKGLQIVQPMTLMSTGFYREPQGAYLPSVLF